MPDAGTELRADARRNRQTLLDVARRVIAEQGTDVSLREVARRAGVGIGTLYRHFPSREALLEAALQEGLDALRAEAEAALDAPDPARALSDWLERFSLRSSAWCAVPGTVLNAMENADSEVHAASAAMAASLGRLLARAQEAGAVRADVDAEDLLTAAKAVGWLAECAPPERTARVMAVLRDGLAT
ncbi:TetR family transcriptional regulator [Streptomyces sp. DSM 44917]|uniref:TetR family transcriptional regulator n=1 Tax=Streptomyces boetiae TaxID=3075541 RepID=A0ABU2L1G3_9ACTN|nr:TetR family transcriptional regulator [Streptomyces sp. DSM 44917]MDT0305402.1 TetR family transcriptional regulator [Streptomyces sp. DSM 44917]